MRRTCLGEALALDGQDDMSFPREFNGVVKQIQQDLSQSAVVADKKRRNTRFDGRLNTQIFIDCCPAND